MHPVPRVFKELQVSSLILALMEDTPDARYTGLYVGTGIHGLKANCL